MNIKLLAPFVTLCILLASCAPAATSVAPTAPAPTAAETAPPVATEAPKETPQDTVTPEPTTIAPNTVAGEALNELAMASDPKMMPSISAQGLIDIYTQLEKIGLADRFKLKENKLDDSPEILAEIGAGLDTIGKNVTDTKKIHRGLAQRYIHFGGVLRDLQERKDNSEIPNACYAADQRVPFFVGPPVWWFVQSFVQPNPNNPKPNNAEQKSESVPKFPSACMVAYTGYTDPAVASKWSTPGFVEVPCVVETQSGQGDVTFTPKSTITLTATTGGLPRQITYQSATFKKAYMKCEAAQNVVDAAGQKTANYDHFWIKVTGDLKNAPTGNLIPLLSYSANDPGGTSRQSKYDIGFFIKPTGNSINGNITTWLGDDKDFNDPNSTDLSKPGASWITSYEAILQTTGTITNYLLVPGLAGPIAPPSSTVKSTPNGIAFSSQQGVFYIGYFGVSDNAGGVRQEEILDGVTLDEIIVDPGPSRGGGAC